MEFNFGMSYREVSSSHLPIQMASWHSRLACLPALSPDGLSAEEKGRAVVKISGLPEDQFNRIIGIFAVDVPDAVVVQTVRSLLQGMDCHRHPTLHACMLPSAHTSAHASMRVH